MHFEATNEEGAKLELDGPPNLGGDSAYFRPMQTVLAALAGCSAIDVIHILVNKQKEPLEDLDVEVEATRSESIPAVFTDIHVTFRASGDIAEKKLMRAVSLSMEKYCSVSKMLVGGGVKVTHAAELKKTP